MSKGWDGSRKVTASQPFLQQETQERTSRGGDIVGACWLIATSFTGHVGCDPFGCPSRQLTGSLNAQPCEHGLRYLQLSINRPGCEPLHRNKSFLVTPKQVANKPTRDPRARRLYTAHLQ